MTVLKPLLVAAALALVALAPPAGAQPSVGARIEEMTIRFADNDTADLRIDVLLDGGFARQLRRVADLNFSGTVSEDEAERATQLARSLLLESPELQRARESLLLDNRTPSDVGQLTLVIEGLTGPTGSTEPAQASLLTTLEWPPQNATANATADERHVLRIPEDAVVASARVVVEVPEGLQVVDVEGLQGARLADEANVVSGQAQQGRAVQVAYAPPPPPPPPEEDEAADEERDVPASAALLALAGAALAALALTRRRGP